MISNDLIIQRRVVRVNIHHGVLHDPEAEALRRIGSVVISLPPSQAEAAVLIKAQHRFLQCEAIVLASSVHVLEYVIPGQERKYAGDARGRPGQDWLPCTYHPASECERKFREK